MNERMALDLGERDSLTRVLEEHLLEQVDAVAREPLGPMRLGEQDGLGSLALGLAPERVSTAHHDVQQRTSAPDVEFGTLDHRAEERLGRRVVERATAGCHRSGLGLEALGQSKVTKQHVLVRVEKHVVGLDVTRYRNAQ
mgnify:CR=1 FL=1